MGFVKALEPLRLEENAELRDGLLIFSARHLQKLIASKHSSLSKSFQAFERIIAADGRGK